MSKEHWIRLMKLMKSQDGNLMVLDQPNRSLSSQNSNANQPVSRPNSTRGPQSALTSLLLKTANIMTATVPEAYIDTGNTYSIRDHVGPILVLTITASGKKDLIPLKIVPDDEVLSKIETGLKSLLLEAGVSKDQTTSILTKTMSALKISFEDVKNKLLIGVQYAECLVGGEKDQGNITPLVSFNICNFNNTRIEAINIAKSTYVIVGS